MSYISEEKVYSVGEYRRGLERRTVTAGTRIFASIVDSVIIILAIIPLLIYVVRKAGGWDAPIDALDRTTLYLMFAYIFSLPTIFQFIIPLFTKGMTLGKMFMGIRMISEDGGKASAGQLFFRSTVYTIIPLFEFIPIFGKLVEFGMLIFWVISLVSLFTDSYHRSLHDRMSGIVVVVNDAVINPKKVVVQPREKVNDEEPLHQD